MRGRIDSTLTISDKVLGRHMIERGGGGKGQNFSRWSKNRGAAGFFSGVILPRCLVLVHARLLLLLRRR